MTTVITNQSWFYPCMVIYDLNFDKVYSDYRKYDSTLGWSLKPNYNKEGYIIDQNGFRSNIKENLYTSQKSKTLLIGDSMVFGYLFNQQDHIFSEKDIDDLPTNGLNR